MAAAKKLPSSSYRVQVYAGKGPDGVLAPSTLRGCDIIRCEHLHGLMELCPNRLTPALIQEAIDPESNPFTDSKGRTKTPSPKSVRNIQLYPLRRSHLPKTKENQVLSNLVSFCGKRLNTIPAQPKTASHVPRPRVQRSKSRPEAKELQSEHSFRRKAETEQ